MEITNQADLCGSLGGGSFFFFFGGVISKESLMLTKASDWQLHKMEIHRTEVSHSRGI